MPLLDNPTIQQLRLIKEQNLERIFAQVEPIGGQPGEHSRIISVGIGPLEQSAKVLVALYQVRRNDE